MTVAKYAHPENRLCEECGLPGIEPSYNNIRKYHIECAAVRRSRHMNRSNPVSLKRERDLEKKRQQGIRDHRYETDPEYRARVDVRTNHSVSDEPYLRALSWRVLWTRHRIRRVDFLALLDWQNNTCPCGEVFTDKPYVDHDHNCCPSVAIKSACGDCIRGLLHPRCNLVLGVIENSPDIIQPIGWAADYILNPPYKQMCNERVNATSLVTGT